MYYQPKQESIPQVTNTVICYDMVEEHASCRIGIFKNCMIELPYV